MDELKVWLDDLQDFHLPRWEELPELDLYKDQLLTLMDKYIKPIWLDDTPIITSSMINNYVKQQVMPAPIKKKYEKKHLAYLIAITFLKQTLTISEIKDGIHLQASLSGNISNAYNFFCEEQENALKNIAKQEGMKTPPIDFNKPNSKSTLMVNMVTQGFACIWVAKKLLQTTKGELTNE